MIGKIDHVVITTAQPDECIAFYRALGFTAREGGGRWELFAGDFKINVHLSGQELEPKAGKVQPGSADFCFELAVPLTDCLARLEAQGIPVALGPVTRHGVRGAMTSVYLRDPDENLIELCDYTSRQPS